MHEPLLFGIDAVYGPWLPVSRRDPRAVALARRHYSARKHKISGIKANLGGPGSYLCLITPDCSALFVWVKWHNRLDGQQGVYCSIFRREEHCPWLASDLIRWAEAWAWQKWPGERLFTYVDARKVRSPNPGYCFLVSGWKRVGVSPSGKILFEKFPSEEEP